MNQNVLIRRADSTVRLPTRATDDSAGWDIYAHKIVFDTDNASATVHTGLYVAFPNTMVICLFGRSGLSSNFGLVPANGTGIIDSDYRGEILVKFTNLSPKAFRRLKDMQDNAEMMAPDRVVQALFLPIIPAVIVETSELPATVRGEGGFGSTG